MRQISLTIIFLFSGISAIFAHSELVAQITLSKNEDQLTLQAVLEKKHLSAVLKEENNCVPSEMLKKCGSNYFTNHFKLQINQKEVKLENESYELVKESVIYNYTVDFSGQILEEIKIFSDYMIHYNSHSLTRVFFELNEETTSYDLNHLRNEIHAKF